MRRVVRHAIAGVAVSAVAVGAAVAGLTDVTGNAADAVLPAANSVPSTSASADIGARGERVSRADTRPELTPEIATVQERRQAAQRAALIGDEGRAIAVHRAEVEAKKKAEAKQRAAAKKKAEAEKKRKAAAKKRAEDARIKRAGYAPGTTDPRDIAKQILKNKYGYGTDQYQCFNNVIIRESNWDIDATNASSGAYGIPQALPGGKMASAGDDWRTNPATQITWGIKYMKDRYGSPCSAWGFKSSHGWY